MQYKLSFLIPSRNEEFLNKTIQDILEHTSNDTEILIGLDGWKPKYEIPQNDRVNIIYLPESIGQRAITNLLCNLSRAKYICKTDAHCSFEKDFDIKMIKAFEETGDNVVMTATMRNLWAYDWKCYQCGKRIYQDKGNICPDCGHKMKKKIIWIAKEKPESNSFCFDSEPHFQYFNEYKYRQIGNIVESMSLQGSFFMCTRDKYWELNLCDEELGSWGSQGIEVACKMWLSGGRVLVNKRTWYGHMFRTKAEKNFGFPYPISGNQVQNAKLKVRELFFDNKWNKQILPLSWLIEKFDPPEKYWSKENRQKLIDFGFNFKLNV